MDKKKLVLGIIVAVIIIAILSQVLINSLGSQHQSLETNNNEFKKNISYSAVTIGGVTFNIPEGYVGVLNKYEKEYDSYNYISYKDTSWIGITVKKNFPESLSQYKNICINNGYTVQEKTIGGYSGLKISKPRIPHVFVYKKNGSYIAVSVGPYLESNIAKIIS